MNDLIRFTAELGHISVEYSLFKVTWTDTMQYLEEGKFTIKNVHNEELRDVGIQLVFWDIFDGRTHTERQPTWHMDVLRPGEAAAREIIWIDNPWGLILEAQYALGGRILKAEYFQELDASDDHEPHGQFNIVTKIYDVHRERESRQLVQIGEQVNKELMRFFQQNPEQLYRVDPDLFERVVGNIFEQMGFVVSYTGRTRDGGIDFFAFDRSKDFQQKFIVQCKRYRRDRKIPVDYVRELYGVKGIEDATKAVLATTSFFTSDAIELGEQLIWHLDLKDYDDIVEWLNRYYRRQ